MHVGKFPLAKMYIWENVTWEAPKRYIDMKYKLYIFIQNYTDLLPNRLTFKMNLNSSPETLIRISLHNDGVNLSCFNLWLFNSTEYRDIQDLRHQVAKI